MPLSAPRREGGRGPSRSRAVSTGSASITSRSSPATGSTSTLSGPASSQVRGSGRSGVMASGCTRAGSSSMRPSRWQVMRLSPPAPAVYMSTASTWVRQRPMVQPSRLMRGAPSRSRQTSVVVPPTSTTRAVCSPPAAPKRAVAAGPLAMVTAAWSTMAPRSAPVPLPQMMVTGQSRPAASMERWMEARKSVISGISRACRQAVADRSSMPGWVDTWCEQNTGLGSMSEIACRATSSWVGFLIDMAPHTA